MRNACMCVVLLVLMLVAQETLAKDGNTPSGAPARTEATQQSWAPYCGLYCLYGAARLQGNGIEFSALLKPEYCGTRRGSTLAELERACRDNGYYGAVVRRMSIRSLVTLDATILLHVKHSLEGNAYDHYVLYLGSAARRLLVFDPPATVRAVSAQELAPIWDGAGLIVSAEPISTGKIFAPARRRFLLWTLGIVSLVLAFHRAGRRAPIGLFRSRRALLGLSLAQGLSLTLAALLGATLFHFFADEGLLANVKATDAIQRTHAGDFMPKVGAKRVRQLMEDETIFVDARFRRDFEAGHLRGAINVPIDANDVQRRHLTESIPKDAKVVVYCRSRSCRFADEVGFRLLNDGFTDVALYRGGWTDWIARGVRP